MPPLRMEIFNTDQDSWRYVGEIPTGMPDGSISDNTATGRDVYLFGVDPVENHGYIKRSNYGVDIANTALRAIKNTGFETVALLGPNESYKMEVKTDQSPVPRKIRFTYIEE